jgi:hypothetical protein
MGNQIVARRLHLILISICLLVMITSQPILIPISSSFASTTTNIKSREEAIRYHKSVIDGAIDNRLNTLDASGDNASSEDRHLEYNSYNENSTVTESTSAPQVQSPSNPWSAWESLGGVIRSNSDPVSIFNTFSGTDLMTFLVGTDDAVYFREEDIFTQFQQHREWFPWQKIGGGITVKANSDPAVSMNSDGRIEVFVVGTDNALWHTQQVHQEPIRG